MHRINDLKNTNFSMAIFCRAMLIYVACLLVLFISQGMASEIDLSLEFQKPVIVQDTQYRDKVFDRITTIDMYDYGDGPWGTPNIPFKIVKILIPQGEIVKNITVSVFNPEEIVRGTPHPVLPVNYSSTIKSGYDYYPEQPFPYQAHNAFYSIVKESGCRGYRILVLKIYPIQYIKSQEHIIYYRNAKIMIQTNATGIIDPLFRGLDKDKKWIESFIDNADQAVIDSYKTVMPLMPTSLLIASIYGQYDYLIITKPELADSFNDFIQWKAGKGIKVAMVSVDDIKNNYAGRDSQEKIRNFIKDAYLYWKIEYVLLGADVESIPARKFYAIVETNFFDVYEKIESNDIPADVYYSAMDGDWNANGNDKWGEPREEDLFSEVFLGRVSFSSPQDVFNYTNKIILYGQSSGNPNEMFPNGMLLGDGYLWGPGDDYPNLNAPHYGEDYLEGGISPIIGEYSLTRLYKRNQNYTKEDVLNLLHLNNLFFCPHKI